MGENADIVVYDSRSEAIEVLSIEKKLEPETKPVNTGIKKYRLQNITGYKIKFPSLGVASIPNPKDGDIVELPAEVGQRLIDKNYAREV